MRYVGFGLRFVEFGLSEGIKVSGFWDFLTKVRLLLHLCWPRVWDRGGYCGGMTRLLGRDGVGRVVEWR